MINYVKARFDHLALTGIVSCFFIAVTMFGGSFMNKKIKKYHTKFLSHSDSGELKILLIMLLLTISLSASIYFYTPNAPK
jgi:hypothetical protein